MTSTMLVVERQGLGLIPWADIGRWLYTAFGFFISFFIIVGGSIPYVFQYAEILHRRNASGFSLFVCLALCVANILRILFWFGKRFDETLLAQSILMLICMVFMLEISVRMNRKHTAKPLRKSLFKGDFKAFWAWHDLGSFLTALGIFTVFWSVVTYFMINNSYYVEGIGLVALLTEATLGLPQLVRNFQRKSTTGMSIPMVLAWLAGDLAKTAYFVAKSSPKQFWLCAIIQITIDCLILGQVFAYRKNTNAELPFSNSGSPDDAGGITNESNVETDVD